jgi:hypothetical protein
MYGENIIALLRIRDILVRIRIRICGSVPLSNQFANSDPDPTSDPAIFVSDLQDGNLKFIFLSKFFAFYFLKLHFHCFSKKKNHKEVHKTVGIKVFLTIFA